VIGYNSAYELSLAFKEGRIKAREIAEHYNAICSSCDDECNTFITLTPELALSQADELDKRFERGEALGCLAGVPIAIKDNIAVKGIKLTCGSQLLRDFVSQYNATVIDRILKEDGIILGKTNLDEFAMGSSTEYSSFKKTRNPLDKACVPGGSSGGSAATVSYGASLLSLGSDTGGSVRQPAAFCGIIGFKPTYGLVSRYGLVAFASSLDQISPFAREIVDIVLMMKVIQGFDEMDDTSSKTMPDFTPYGGEDNLIELLSRDDYPDNLKPARDWVIGIPKEYVGEGIDIQVQEQFNALIDRLKSRGVTFKEVSLPLTPMCISAYYIIANAEASSNLARFDGIRYGSREDSEDIIETFFKTRTKGFGEEVKRRIMLGTYVLKSGYYEAYYKKALKIKALLKRDMDKALQDCNLLLAPTTPTPAFRFGEKLDNPVTMYMGDILTVSSNLTGTPAISLPMKPLRKGDLPNGVQVMGKRFSEPEVYLFAKLIEVINKA